MKRSFVLIGALALMLSLAGAVLAQKNPRNPCGPKGESVASMPAVDPGHAEFGTVFYVADPMGRNTISFESQAPLEDILGSTNEISGYVVLDPKHPTRGARGHFSVPTSSLKTGIPLRDEHLQSAMWLDAQEHPEITFVIDDIKNVKEVKKTDAFQTYDVIIVGQFTLHGKTRKIEVPGRLTYMTESEMTRMKMPGDLVAGRASFDVALGDYGVKGMAGVVGSKVSDTITVDISFIGTNAAEMAGNPCGGKKKAMNPCNPCGDK